MHDYIGAGLGSVLRDGLGCGAGSEFRVIGHMLASVRKRKSALGSLPPPPPPSSGILPEPRFELLCLSLPFRGSLPRPVCTGR